MRVTVPLHPAKRYHWKHVTTASRAHSEEAGELSLKDFLLTCSLTHTHTLLMYCTVILNVSVRKQPLVFVSRQRSFYKVSLLHDGEP